MTLALPLFGAELEQELVGGKAVGCAQLLMLGLRVPRGFILTTRAFDALLAANALEGAYARLLSAFLQTSDEEGLAARCAALQRQIRSASVPGSVLESIAEQASGLDGPFAVRSSASAEDSSSTAFAGIFHSALQVDRGELSGAALECWSHGVSYEALTHAMRVGVDPRDCRLALLVQQMVQAEYAGAIFSREPSGANRRAAAISFVAGLADRLMDGVEGGETTIVDRWTGGVLRSEGGALSLPRRLRRRLVRVARRVERRLGRPQDIEWAACSAGLYLLQARPITTLNLPRRRTITWTREITEERFPRPMSPLGWSVLGKVLEQNVATLADRFGLIARRPEDVARTIGHYVYTNEKFFKIPGSMRFNPARQARFAHEHARELGIFFLQLPGAALRGGLFGPRWLLLARLFSAFVFPHAREILGSWDAELDAIVARMDAFKAVDPASLSDAELWPYKRSIEVVSEAYMEPDLAIYVVKSACIAIVEQIGKQIEGKQDSQFLTQLTSGLADNRTLRMNAELEALFDTISARADLLELLRAERYATFLERLPPSQRERFDEYVEQNGHVTTNWDIRVPTWGADPNNFLRLLRSYLTSQRCGALKTFERGESEICRGARDRALATMTRAPWMAEFFDEVLETLREFMRIDEEHHFHCSRLMSPARRLYLEIGSRLVKRGQLRSAEEIFFLHADEIERQLEASPTYPLRYMVDTRQASMQRAWRQRPPLKYQDMLPLPEEQALSPTSRVLQGVGASPGIARGSVRIVEEPADIDAFVSGEIMVTTSPNPTWTPIYAVAAGLVTSTGSLLSHGLVCAREYSLPAVIGIPGVTGKLTNGQPVQVDGSRGTVTLDPT